VAAGAVGDLGAGEHARQLFNAAGFIEPSDAHLRPALQRFFLHDEMTISKPRYLRLVRHAQHLIRLRKFFQLKPDSFTDAPADAGIDLVKHDRARKLRTVCHCLQHQHQTRRFAAGCYTREWLNVLAGVCGKVKLSVIDAFLSGSLDVIRDLNLKLRIIDRDLCNACLDCLFKLLRCSHSFFVQLTCKLQISIASDGKRSIQLSFTFVRRLDLSQAILGAREVFEKVRPIDPRFQRAVRAKTPGGQKNHAT
jgi:hypothetical protein